MNFSVVYCELCSGQEVRFGPCLGEKLASGKEGQAAERTESSQKQSAGSSAPMASPSPVWLSDGAFAGAAVGSTPVHSWGEPQTLWADLAQMKIPAQPLWDESYH